jgi:calmodulin
MDEDIPIDQNEAFKKTFDLFDSENLGTIPREELATVMRALGQNPSEEEIQEYIQEYDPYDTKVFHYDSFRALMIKRLTRDNKEKELMDAFKAFDKDMTGTIKCEDLRDAFLAFNKDLNEEQVEEMLKEFDIGGLGDITYKDVVKTIVSAQNTPAKGAGKKKGKGKKSKKK